MQGKSMKMRLAALAVSSLLTLPVFGQTKAEVSRMLDLMAKSGKIDAQYVEAARKELEKMDQKDLDQLIEKGAQMQNDPKVRQKIKEMGLDAP